LLRQKRRATAALKGNSHVTAEESGGKDTEVPSEILTLSPEEVTRRLRLLKEPKRLFGETDDMRRKRLAVAETSVEMVDEATGGQQANVHVALQRQEKKSAEQPGQVENREYVDNQDEGDATLMASFKAAADTVVENSLSSEEIIDKRLRTWMAVWSEDLAKRSTEDKLSAAGKQEDVRYKETKEYFRPLFHRLKNKTLDPELLAGFKLITDAMKDRNYLHAYKIYMGVAIGNSPWPIGVTHVGLHERANRERISFKYAHGNAHIMNDEASRKFIQALKRLMTFCQRRYPTDPSRCVDFDGATNSIGDSMSNKVLLLEAEARGEQIKQVQPPCYFQEDGTAKIPERWENVIKHALD
jgi:pre-mRNA-splicing factor 18